jgi:hypothetical protein
MCQVQFQTFFGWGGVVVFLMAATAMMVAFSCQSAYPSICPHGFYILLVLIPVAILQSCTMMCISHSLAKVEKLSLEELAPETMSAGTKRWGWVSKSCPAFSRVGHFLLGLITLGGMAVGSSTCKDGSDEECAAPLSTPSPLRDFGIVLALWLLLALLGCRATSKNTALPHIYEPQPESQSKAVGKGCSLCKMCHP